MAARHLAGSTGGVHSTSVIDLHTHLFSPQLGALGLWGIDNLRTYHYLEAELFRCDSITPAECWKLSVEQRTDRIWRVLFVERTPVSEACRGVIAVLHAFGIDTHATALTQPREFFAGRELSAHIDEVFRLAGMTAAVMTNDPLNPAEVSLWSYGIDSDPRFHAVLRLDRILNHWDQHWLQMQLQGCDVDATASGGTIVEVRRFLVDGFQRMNPLYMACSLPDTFMFPQEDARTKLLAEAVLPACREFGVPMSLMIDVRRQVNPELMLAGDAVGRADLRALEHVLVKFPEIGSWSASSAAKTSMSCAFTQVNFTTCFHSGVGGS